MRATIVLDDKLLDDVRFFTENTDTSALVHAALKALVEREAARRLVLLGGSDPTAAAAHRRRPDDDDAG